MSIMKDNNTSNAEHKPASDKTTVPTIVSGERILVVRINGNDTLVTSGKDGNEFQVYKMPKSVRTESTAFDDPIVVGLSGVVLLLAGLVVGWMITSATGQSNANSAPRAPYQPMPYSNTVTKCKPSGLLWLGETCNTEKETGYR